jgi:hypothetical protein
MSDNFADSKFLLCGRKFSTQVLQDIRETVRVFPHLSQRELGS